MAIVLAILVSGCASKWIRLDGGPVMQAEFQEARATCRIDERLDQIEAQRNTRLSSANSNEAMMLVQDDFAAAERAAYAEINACMLQQGYKKAD